MEAALNLWCSVHEGTFVTVELLLKVKAGKFISEHSNQIESDKKEDLCRHRIVIANKTVL